MKRSLLITIVVLLMAALFVSCNANKVEEDQLFEVTVDGGSRALSLSGTFEADAEDLYWYYTATKTSGMFNNGTQTWKAVKAGKGLANTSLGDFSKGGWSFSFYGFTTEQASKPENPATVAVFYQEGLTQTIYQAVVLNVTLARGTGALAAAEVSFAQMIKYAAAGASLGANDVVTLKVYDGTDLKVTKTGAIDSESNKYAFTFATADTFTVADGAHTLHFVVYDQIDNDEPYIIGQSDITFTAKNGMKYVINDVSGIDYIDEQVGASTGSVTVPVLGTDTITASTTDAVVATVPNTPVGTSTVNTTVSFPAASFTGSPELAVETFSSEVAAAKFNVTATTANNDEAVVAGINLTLTPESGTAITTFTGDEYVTVTTYIATNLTDVKVLYNGSEYINGTSGDKYLPDGGYDPATGKLVFRTNHFSEFVVQAKGAAKIGDTYYGTFDAAIAALQDGDTLTLADDIDFSEERYASYKWAATYNPLTITKNNVTIDLGGHTISNMGNTAICIGHLLAKDGRIENVTIKNGTLEAGQTNGVTNSYVLGIAGVDGAKIENITTTGGINVYTASKDVVIENCTVNGTKYYSVCAQCGSHAIIKNSTLTKNTDSSVATKAMFWVDGAGSDGDLKTTDNPTGAYDASSISIESGSFTVDTANGGLFYLSSGLKPVVTGGTYNIDPTDYLAEGYAIAKEGDYWTVAPCVAKIGSVGYQSLADAVAAAANANDEIVVMKDIPVTFEAGYYLTIPAAKTITIDLNGYNVEGICTKEGTSALVRNLGNLTIKDSSAAETGRLAIVATPSWVWDGTDNYAGSYASNLIRNEGTLTIESGKYENSTGGSAAYAIDNYTAGIVTINGGELTTTKASAIRFFYTSSTASLTVNGGVIGGSASFMGVQLMGTAGSNIATVELNSGEFNGAYALYAQYGKTTINGGTYNSIVGFAGAVPASDIAVEGGVFNDSCVSWATEDIRFITGGTFATDPSDYVVDGYEAVQSGDVWVVSKKASN